MTLLLPPDQRARPDCGVQAPRVRTLPGTGTWSAVDDLLVICQSAIHLGGPLELMPWQEQLLADILTVRPDGRWAARDAAYLVARQNGKGGVLHAIALAGLFLFDDVREILHSAHEVKTAKKAFRELKELIKNTPYLYAQVERRGNRVVGFRQSNEDTSITLQDGSVIRFIARATNTGRGFSPQWLIIDEAQICTEESREAIFYSTRAQANPLRVWCGTAPKPNDPSDVFTALRDRGRSGGDEHMTWSEWSVDPESKIEDLRGDDAAVAISNPALGYLVDWETIDSERVAAVSDEAWAGFCREALSWWPNNAGTAPRWDVISETDWNDKADTNGADTGWLAGPASLGIEMPFDRSSVSVGAAGACRTGGIGLQLVAQVSVQDLVPLIVQLTTDPAHPVSHVALDPKGPAGGLLDDLTAAGVTVLEAKYDDLKKCTGDLFDDLTGPRGQVWHRGQDAVNAAVGHMVKRSAGDTWLVDRKGEADSAPFGCLNLARWAHLQPVEDPASIYETRGLVEL